jgi:Ricin-type beta-trefoil lectin domain
MRALAPAIGSTPVRMASNKRQRNASGHEGTVDVKANGFRVGVGAVALLLAGCVAPEDDGGVSEKQEAIVNGTDAPADFVSTVGMVAVYDRADAPNTQNWSTRPCSGTIVYGDATGSWVLTARHCITADGTITGTPLPAGDFKLLPGTNPGPTVHSPTPTSPLEPPAAAITANFLVAAPVVAGQQLDTALLRVPADWSDIVDGMPLLMSPVSGVNKAAVSVTGYGVSDNDTGCQSDTDSSGAGIARYATGFTVNTATSFAAGGGSFAYLDSSTPGGARVTCGDSGGGDYTPWPKSDPIVQTLIGVHSVAVVSGSGNAGDTFSGAWVSDILDGLYLFQWGGGNVDWDSTFNLTVGLGAGPFFIYGEQQQSVFVDFGDFSMCVQKRSRRDNHAMLATCNGSAGQKWQVTADNRIRNPSTNTCLQASGTSILVRTCVAGGTSATSRLQTWYWRGSPNSND